MCLSFLVVLIGEWELRNEQEFKNLKDNSESLSNLCVESQSLVFFVKNNFCWVCSFFVCVFFSDCLEVSDFVIFHLAEM